VALIATARGAIAAMFRLATQLLVADEGERGAELFVLDDRGLRDLAHFVKGPIRQFDPAVTDRQPAYNTPWSRSLAELKPHLYNKYTSGL
jgi:hypothetical protein